MSTLSSDIINCWNLEENGSSSRVDVISNQNMTSINTVGSAVGKVGTGAQFVSASVQYLQRFPPDVDVAPPFTIALWVKLTTVPTTDHMVLVSVGTTTGAGQ